MNKFNIGDKVTYFKESIMTIKEIYSISISKTETMLNQQYSATMKISDPQSIECIQEPVDIYGGKGNLVIKKLSLGLKDLFSEGTEVVLYGLFSTDDDKEIKGTYNIITGVFKEEQIND